MKKFFPIILALVAFVVVWIFLKPDPESSVAVAAKDLPVGHVLEAGDVTMRSFPKDILPLDAVTNSGALQGKILLIDRMEGDVFRSSQVVEELIALQPDERAIAVTVDNAAGLAGLLKYGDYVGVNAIISLPGSGEEGTYSKATIENLRILYLSPEFQAVNPNTPIQQVESGAASYRERERSGVAVLVVPISARTIIYDFSKVENSVSTKSKTVYVIELLSALEASQNAKLMLYLMPKNPQDMITSGLWLQDVVIFSRTPTPTIDPALLMILTPQP